jgi:hypothetical protein
MYYVIPISLGEEFCTPLQHPSSREGAREGVRIFGKTGLIDLAAQCYLLLLTMQACRYSIGYRHDQTLSAPHCSLLSTSDMGLGAEFDCACPFHRHQLTRRSQITLCSQYVHIKIQVVS